jgi:exo-1,4-beta-D-glucosaminidase
MYWQLYDSYLQPNGAFYATRKAGNRIHAIYAYGKDEIYLANNHLDGTDGLTVKVKIYDINSKQVFSDEWKGDIAGNSSKKISDLSVPKNISDVWFLDIRTFDKNGTEVDNSFYWLSTKKDELDYKAAEKLDWAYYTPSKGYADFTALNNLKDVKLSYNYKFEKDNDSGKVQLTVENKSDAIAFFVRFDILDSDSGTPILPIFWDDNYISLLPGEARSYNCHYNLKDSNGKKPKIEIKGYNVKPVVIE